MADHGSSASHSHGFEEHARTYQGFVTGSVILALLCGYILVALVAFRFIESGNVLLGFAGLIVGCIAILIDARAGGKWLLSGGLLALYGLVVGYFVS